MSEVRAVDVQQQTVETARRWAAAAAARPADRDAARLAGVVRDPEGLAFSLAVVDGVLRPDDAAVAARSLDVLSREMPGGLPWHLRAAISAAGGFGPLAPRSVVGVARRALRRTLQHLVVDAPADKLGPALRSLTTADGVRLDASVLGPAVLGVDAADRRRAALLDLLARDEVSGVTTTVAAVAGPSSPWATDEASATAVERLSPLAELALASDPQKSLSLEVEGYADLDLTIDVLTRLLDQPHLLGLEAGIVLPTALPDALSSLELLTDWARGRVGRGGAPIRVRLTRGHGSTAEVAEAERHGWPVATWRAPVDVDAAHLRALDWALRPAHAEVARVEVVARDVVDLAHAWTLAKQREVTHLLDLGAELGLGDAATEVVVAETGTLVRHAPVVPHDDPAAAVPWFLTRLHENAAGAGVEADLDAALARWLEAAAVVDAEPEGTVPPSHRRQDRSRPSAPPVRGAHEQARQAGAADAPSDPAPADLDPADGGEADTDPAVERNRSWARRVLAAARTSHAGVETVGRSRVLGLDELEAVVARTAQAGVLWGREEPATRSRLLERAADALAAGRAALIEVLVSETGTTIGEADHEVSETVDQVRHHARLARGLEAVDGARWAPPRLTVVVPDATAAVATPADGATAALAAGSAVVLKPAPQARRSSAVLCELLWASGVPRDLLALAELDEDDLGRDLVTHPAVDRVVLTGSAETARLFRSWRPDLPLVARTAGHGVVVVTPSADVDLAVADLVRGATARAGRSRDATTLVLLVGSAATDERFRRQLVDAVESLPTGWPDDPATRVGPLVDPASGALRAALTTLEPGERWLVEPRQLDEEGVLWSLGVVEGLSPDGARATDAPRGPVLGLLAVDTLDEALRLQARLGGGVTAGISSRDVDEVDRFLRRAEAGRLVVNGSTADVVARRQPSAGWGASSVGAVASTGPSAVVAQGRWWSLAREPHPSLRLTGVGDRVAAVVEAARPGLTFEQFDAVRAGAVSDERAWESVLGAVRDTVVHESERVVLRHRPCPVVVRLSAGGDLADLVRLLAAATRAGAPVDVSAAVPLPAPLVQLVRSPASPLRVGEITVEGDDSFRARAAAGLLQRVGGDAVVDDLELLARATGSGDATPQAGGDGPGGAEAGSSSDHLPAADAAAVAAYRELRIRLVGGDARALAAAVGGSTDVSIHAGDVTAEGRVELLPFVREQSVVVTTHRHGHVDEPFRRLRL